jgi:hypothetical protein
MQTLQLDGDFEMTTRTSRKSKRRKGLPYAKFARKLKGLVKQLESLEREFGQEFLRASVRRSIQ